MRFLRHGFESAQIVWSVFFLCGAANAASPKEEARWFIDWGGKTQHFLNTTTGLPGIRAGMIRDSYALGAAAYTLTGPISEDSPLIYRRQATYTLGGLYAEYRYALTDWLLILPNVFVGYGAGSYETRDYDVAYQTVSGGYVIEPALNLCMEFMRHRYFNIGGGYSIVNQVNGLKNGAIFNIAFRMEW